MAARWCRPEQMSPVMAAGAVTTGVPVVNGRHPPTATAVRPRTEGRTRLLTGMGWCPGIKRGGRVGLGWCGRPAVPVCVCRLVERREVEMSWGRRDLSRVEAVLYVLCLFTAVGCRCSRLTHMHLERLSFVSKELCHRYFRWQRQTIV